MFVLLHGAAGCRPQSTNLKAETRGDVRYILHILGIHVTGFSSSPDVLVDMTGKPVKKKPLRNMTHSSQEN